MDFKELKKAFEEKIPVTLKSNILEERQKLFSSKNVPSRGIENNIGKKLYVYEIGIKAARIEGMKLNENGKEIKSFELLIPLTSIEFFK